MHAKISCFTVVNLVKATLSAAMVVPRGSVYLAVVMIEWLEVVCMGLLPLVLISFIVLCLVLGLVTMIVAHCCSKPIQEQASGEANNPDQVTEFWALEPISIPKQ